MNISDKLKELRGNANLSQEQVAEKIMVSRVTLSHWENGKSLPDIASLLSLSKLYNVSLDELVKGDSKMEEKLQADIFVSDKAQLCGAIGAALLALE